MEIQYIIKLCGLLADGIGYTLKLFCITLILSLPLGFLLTLARNSRFKPLSAVTGLYVWIMRGTPLMLQLFFFYFGLPFISKYLAMERFTAACVTFVLNYAAYFCEIFRGGILSVDKGQYEAAKVLRLTNAQTNLRIVMPQMLRVALPSITNEAISLVKDTAMATAIGVTEILYYAKTSVNRDVDISAYIVAAVFYLILTYGITWLFRRLEKKLTF